MTELVATARLQAADGYPLFPSADLPTHAAHPSSRRTPAGHHHEHARLKVLRRPSAPLGS